MEAAASPLPSDETTPPVTKMYLIGLDSFVCISSTPNGALPWAPRHPARAPSASSRARTRSRSAGVSTPTLWAVVSTAVIPIPVLQHAQLFEHLGVLERRRREAARAAAGTLAGTRTGRHAPRRRAAGPPRHANGEWAHGRNRAPCRGGPPRPSRCWDSRIRPARTGAGEASPSSRQGPRTGRRPRRSLRLEQRLVALDVDDQIAVERRGDLGESIGAAPVLPRRHSRRAAKALDRGHDPLRRRSRR